MALTNKQQAFVAEYLTDFNAAQSAIRAGYSKRNANVIGYNTLNKPEVAEAIAAATAERLERLKMKADEVVVRLSRIGRARMSDVVDWGVRQVPFGYDADGNLVDDIEDAVLVRHVDEPYLTPRPRADLDEDALEAISEVALTKDGGFKIKLHDKGAALDKLARFNRLFTEDGGEGVRFTLVIESPHNVPLPRGAKE